MVDDDPQPGDPSEKKPAVPTNDVPELSPDPLVVAGDATPLALANPVALIQGLRRQGAQGGGRRSRRRDRAPDGRAPRHLLDWEEREDDDNVERVD